MMEHKTCMTSPDWSRARLLLSEGATSVMAPSRIWQSCTGWGQFALGRSWCLANTNRCALPAKVRKSSPCHLECEGQILEGIVWDGCCAWRRAKP
jgi:hypothetical protein